MVVSSAPVAEISFVAAATSAVPAPKDETVSPCSRAVAAICVTAERSWIVRALGEWGVPLMVEPAPDDEFRSDWLSFPVSLFFTREAPPGPPVAIELRTGDHPMTIETADGAVRTRSGAADEPDLVLTGDPQPILGLLSGYLEPAEARDRGVQVEGDLDILDRLRPQAAVTAR